MKKLKMMNNAELREFVLTHSAGVDVAEAIHLMSHCHDGVLRNQARPCHFGVDPYENHCLRNAARIIQWNDYIITPRVKNTVIATLLHDTVEDAPRRIKSFYGIEIPALELLSIQFGENVSSSVKAVSNPDWPSDMTKKEKRSAYLDHLREVLPGNKCATLVKAADLVDNAGSLQWLPESKRSMRESMSKKYAPAVELVIELCDNFNNVAGDSASKKLRRVQSTLV